MFFPSSGAPAAGSSRAHANVLGPWLLLLLLEESQEGDSGDLDDLETNTGNISDGVSLSSESGDKNLVVLVDVVQATVMRNEGGDLLSVLDELNPGALADSGVWLLGLNSDLLDHDSLGVRATSKWLLPLGSDVRLLVVLIGPQLRLPVQAELTSGSKSTRFTVLGFLKKTTTTTTTTER